MKQVRLGEEQKWGEERGQEFYLDYVEIERPIGHSSREIAQAVAIEVWIQRGGQHW